MRKSFFLLSLLILPFLSGAQSAFKPVGNPAAFQASFSRASAAVKTLQSSFTQIKTLSLLSEKVVSKGRFYLQKEDKVRIEYTTPFKYLMVMNGGQMMVRDEQKSSRIDARNSKTLQAINRIMLDCMRGTVFTNRDFKVSALESANGYMLNLVPATPAIAKLYKKIDVYLDKKTFDVTRLLFSEPGGDATDMVFAGPVHNGALSADLFKVR